MDPKTGRKTTHRVKKIIRRYEPAERVEIVREFLTGKYTVRQIMDKYMINAEATLFSWLVAHISEAQSLSLQANTVNDSDMANKSKDDQIKELKERLRQAEKRAEMEELRAKAYSKMIDVAEETFNIPIRKKSGTKQ
ncbi:MAG: transposase [Muribaculaceae bacterium]|nr:transposase [Muribaculaceae bacterium]